MKTIKKTFFAPQLYIPHGVTDVRFYEQAFDAVELRRFSNDDGSIHVSELSIDDCLFHLHEENHSKNQFKPEHMHGTTVLIGLFVSDVDAVMTKALAAGAVLLSPAESYDYGYRQGEIRDPYGHVWLIEMRIDNENQN